MRYKLGEIFNLQMGKTPDRHSPKFWNEGTEPWISIADLTKCIKYIENTAEKITATAVDESGIKIIPKNTVIMSFKLSIGKVAITPKEMYSNEAIMSFIDKGVLKIEPVYLYYLLMHKDWDTDTNKAVMGKTLNKATLSQMTVNIHGYSEQLEIIKALDTASSIITARKQQLAELDNLIKARFVEMFGDPLKNDKSFSTVLGEVLFKLSNGKALPNNKRFTVGVPAYGGNGVSWYTDEILCDYDTIIIGRVGFQSGNVHLAKAPLWVTDNAMYISGINNKECDIRFLCSLMEHLDFKRYQDAGDLKKITQKPFMQMHYLLPPISLQKQYIAFVEQTDKSKVAVQKALDEAQLLFDSLMQKYFG